MGLLRRLAIALFISLPILLAVTPPTADPQTAVEAATPSIIGKVRWAYYVPYADDSLDSLKKNAGSLTHLSPYWYTVDGAGNVHLLDADGNESNRETVIQLARNNKIKIIPMVKNSATYADFTNVLSSVIVREKVINQLVTLVKNNGFDGIHIDFEGISAEDRVYLTQFMARLAPAMRNEGKLVTQAVPAKETDRTVGWAGAFDYAALAEHNDYIVVMTYGYGIGVPQSTSPFPWVERSIAYAASQMTAEKVLLGLAWYGYDWNLTQKSVSAVTHYQAMERAASYGATMQYNDVVKTPYFKYTVDGNEHEVWFEDSRSNDEKLDLVFSYDLAGAAGWRIGHEDSGVWQSYRDRLGFQTWYLAEGSTAKPYDTWILIQNPNPYMITTTVTFLKEDGNSIVLRQEILPGARYSIYANKVVPSTAFSTKVEAPGPIFVERAMYFGYDGHDSVGVNSPNRRWYLPEGSTEVGTHTWVLLMNPGNKPVQAKVTFLRETASPIVREFQVNPTSRLNIFANQHVPQGLFSTVIEADNPIVAERASYTDRGKAGDGTRGATLLSRRWYLAEGWTSYRTRLAIMNPSSTAAQATVHIYYDNGTSEQTTLALQPMSRVTHYPPHFSPGVGYSVVVESDQRIAVERTSFILNAGVQGSLGSVAPARTWYLAEGSTASPFQTFLLLQNPQDRATIVRVTFMPESGRQVTMVYEVKPHSRLSVPVNYVVPNEAVSIQVKSDLPVVAERTMFFGRGAHASSGIPQ